MEHRAEVAACPTQEVLGRLGDKWVPLVLTALRDGRRRHGELARTVAGARQKVLTQTLRGLERDGLVAVSRWADEHVPALHEARRGYDAGESGRGTPGGTNRWSVRGNLQPGT
jgi:hypothetical protein